MKKTPSLLLLLLTVICSFGQPAAGDIALIPQPVSLVKGTGSFVLPKRIVVQASAKQPALNNTVRSLSSKLSAVTGYTVIVSETANPGATIQLLLNKQPVKSIGKEGYNLKVTTAGVVISANEPAGLFYGVQTLLQLFPAAIESKTLVTKTNWVLPTVEIMDYPRFEWRGLMFDVARHFFSKADVKEFIDEMVRYKYNLLHLHLTDDEGWRIEIKALPKLTEIGAWNVKKTGYFGTFSLAAPDEPRNYGGFFTQDDIKELVQYAKERFVNILPEIDVPGHSLAAIAAYPELSCSNGVDNHGVSSGESIKDWSTHTALVDDNLCPANENVYDFLDKVITEVAALFPFEYIHMGGDETFKTYWQKSDAVKALMQKEGLKNMEEVQSYFEKRVEKIVESKGKKFMGWDEILEGGLAPDAVVMSWQGMAGGIKAAQMGHEVVMSPTTFAYLDYMQGDAAIESHVYANLFLKKTYEFEPLPDSVDAKFIKGGQANLWTEQVYNMRYLQYMIWPRAFAIAESVWSPKTKKDWKNFVGRVEKHFDRYDMAEIKYAPSIYDPVLKAGKDANGKLLVDIETQIDGLSVHYSFDNSPPDNFYPAYAGISIPVPKDAFQLKVITYRNNKPIGRLMNITVADLQKRAGRK